MGVTQTTHGDAADRVEVAFAIVCNQPTAFTAHKGQGARTVCVHQCVGHGLAVCLMNAKNVVLKYKVLKRKQAALAACLTKQGAIL